MGTIFSTIYKNKGLYKILSRMLVILAIGFLVSGNASGQELPIFPEGFHDGMEGTVNAAGCSAFGWAVDPDDLDRDLKIQILSDGSQVATTTANLLREDVGSCTGGTCGFYVNLWGVISADKAHKITVQAFDEESGDWWNLEATPKSLTCQPISLTYVVNTNDDVDNGECDQNHCSLREAINAANTNPAMDTITFKIPDFLSLTIQPASPLPDINDPVIIDGTTQPEYSGSPIIELDGTYAGEWVNGLVIFAGDTRIKGLVINRFSGSGITIVQNGNNVIEDNFIGTDVTGTQSLGNAGPGVAIGDQASENQIFGNLISGNNSDGVALFNSGTSSNILQGNHIGTDYSGSAALPNFGVGIWIGEGASDTIIGGVGEGEGNLVSGNLYGGISINHSESTGTVVFGNYIGTTISGDTALSNGGDGVLISANQTQIGGTEPGAGNLISGNNGNGISITDESTSNIVQGNLIGTDVTGTTATVPARSEPADFSIEVDFACPTYDTGTDFDGFISQSADPLVPWSGTSVHFKGTDECGETDTFGESSLIYRYRLVFEPETQLESISVSGTAFNGPDNVLRVLDETMQEVLGMVYTYGGNSFQTQYLLLDDVSGTVFYLEEYDTSSTWRFRQNIVVNGPLPLGNFSNGVTIADGASGNLIGGTEPGARNIISGNLGSGVGIFSPGTTGNLVQVNFIGTDVTGTQSLGNAGFGVAIGDQASENQVIGNLISGNNSDGLALFNSGTSGNVLQGNYIGTDYSGLTALPNAGVGIWIGEGASDTIIGGVSEDEGNLVSGNSAHGISINHLDSTGTIVLGNFIGTNLSSDAAIPNGAGGVFISANQSQIGGIEPGAGNIISGNFGHGVEIIAEASENTIQGNFIGTNADNLSTLPNTSNGVGLYAGANNNLVGGIEPGAGNIIAFNYGGGITANFEADSGNSFLANSIFSNGWLGIDLNEDGVTPNDPLDWDDGPNGLQNFPYIIRVNQLGSNLQIHGILVSTPNATFRLEFFSSEVCDPSGFGEGQIYLGTVNVTTNPVGITSFKITLPFFAKGSLITATATDEGGNTSEFSQCAGLVK